MIRGPGHHLWREDATQRRIHAWLRERYPKTGCCEECGAIGNTDYAFTRHPEPYTRNRDDYREMCRRCHNTMDRKPQTHCRRGHELVPTNLIVSGGRRWCKTCRNERRRVWRAERATA